MVKKLVINENKANSETQQRLNLDIFAHYFFRLF